MILVIASHIYLALTVTRQMTLPECNLILIDSQVQTCRGGIHCAAGTTAVRTFLIITIIFLYFIEYSAKTDVFQAPMYSIHLD